MPPAYFSKLSGMRGSEITAIVGGNDETKLHQA